MSVIYVDPVIDWSPSMIPTAMWYDPADSTKITLSGNQVLSMLDKSGNNRDLSEDQLYPTYVSNSLNDLPGINFDADKRLYNNGIPATVSFVITVIKSSGGTTWGDYHTILDKGANGTRIGGILEASNSGFHNSVFPAAAWQNGTSVTVNASCFTSIADPFIAAYNTTVTSMTSVSMGNYDAASGGGCATQYETIALADIPSQADREKLEGYLAHKWGLSASLPAAHPYKTFRPTA